MVDKQTIKLKLLFLYRMLNPVIILPVMRILKGIPLYFTYFRELSEYRKRDKNHSVNTWDLYPLIFQKTSTTSFDPHYFYQGVWGFKKIQAIGCPEHVDVGSKVEFVGLLSTIAEVTFIDIRKLEVRLKNFHSKRGSILSLPYPDRSVPSLSCLHVIEHIGLGRYGDPIDPDGSEKGALELRRVLAPGGHLLVSVPVGRYRVCFNAHRVFEPSMVIQWFEGFELVEFSIVTDEAEFLEHQVPEDYKNAEFANGLFLFKRPEN
jgi:SAM-dependent methyltransferase